jgi:hypothetical protein
MNYYKGLNKYEGVNGMGSVDEIFEPICSVVERYIA